MSKARILERPSFTTQNLNVFTMRSDLQNTTIMIKKLWPWVSLQASKHNMIQCAQYFENKVKHDKAVQLFSRGGNHKRAMDLAIKHNLTDMIENISTGVKEGYDPEVFKKSVHFMMQNRQFDKVVEIMISLVYLDQALQIAEQDQVNLK